MRTRSRLCAPSWTGRMCLSVCLLYLESQCASKVYHSFLTMSITAQSRTALKGDAFDQLFVVLVDPLLDSLVRDEPLVWILCPQRTLSTDFFVHDEQLNPFVYNLCNRPLIVSHERFCNLIGAARNRAVEVDSLTPQCCQALFPSERKLEWK